MSKKTTERALEKSRTKQKKLKKKLSDVQARLVQSEARLAKSRDRANRWKTDAKEQRRLVVHSSASSEQLRQQLAATASDGGHPDGTWTVIQLRGEARARGLTGMSNLSKSELLAALS